MKVLFFGRLRDAAGYVERDCAPPEEILTIAALRAWLAEDNPALGDSLSAPGVRVARDQSFCDVDTPLAGAHEIAFMSPLSGG